MNFNNKASDFGNENVELVRSVSELILPKAVILGNHDCWTTQQFSQKKKDRVQLQLECLGEEHVGYRRLDFPNLKLSVVGGRHGGNKIFREKLLSSRYGVQDMNGSAEKICKASVGTPEGHSIVLLAHNGPTGLGSEKNDICGRDWVHQGGDHGDPDLEQAISNTKETTKFPIPLVVFGHMHKELASRNGHLRKMIVVGADNTIYLNGAIVPRVKKLFHEQRTGTGSSSTEGAPVCLVPEPSGTVGGFTLVEINDGKPDKIAETWVSIIGDEIKIEEELILFQSEWLLFISSPFKVSSNGIALGSDVKPKKKNIRNRGEDGAKAKNMDQDCVRVKPEDEKPSDRLFEPSKHSSMRSTDIGPENVTPKKMKKKDHGNDGDAILGNRDIYSQKSYIVLGIRIRVAQVCDLRPKFCLCV
ncbi:uncharacterized protein LOC113313076 [Papaver somniferum]|uniref:uncharacterized protein LOC113313076 n=1 Tax=Papaver somniferum TaxID=3469 RepID=UPI000E6FF736|nr:uncharacterized protein LOC113313076 [Papaver somniferum]